MTLHEAIIRVLQQKGRTMSTQEIADELNKNSLYSKRDGSAITDFQIYGRTRKYTHLFNRDGSNVSLKSNTHAKVAKVAPSPSRPIAQVAQVAQVADVPLTDLMNLKNFKPANTIQNLIPAQPGLYCIRMADAAALPEPFATHLKNRKHNILYIGIATTSLRQRIGQEFWAEGHGTFFRGMGAVLGYRPPAGSLINKKNKKNYTFSAADEASIIKWINKNLLVNWVIFDGDFESTETELITKYKPLMNSSKNPEKLPELAALRKICREIANA
jgi:hypothetical protein